MLLLAFNLSFALITQMHCGTLILSSLRRANLKTAPRDGYFIVFMRCYLFKNLQFKLAYKNTVFKKSASRMHNFEAAAFLITKTLPTKKTIYFIYYIPFFPKCKHLFEYCRTLVTQMHKVAILSRANKSKHFIAKLLKKHFL